MSEFDHKTTEIIKRYLKDIVHSFNALSSRYTPLQTDSVDTEFSSGDTILQGDLRRGMGIVEAHRTLKRFVLIGDPGAGKSTALQYLSLHNSKILLDHLSDTAAIDEGLTPGVVPVFLEINSYRPQEGTNSIRSMISGQFYPYAFSGDFDETIEKLLNRGSLLVILDGLNECPLNLWDHAVRDIKHFLALYPKTSCIISCRSRDFPDLFHISVLSVRPLSLDEIDKFIANTLQDVEDFSSKRDTFKSTFYREFPQIVSNPLILTMALKVYRESNWELPLNYGRLFRKFFVLWFSSESIKLRKTSTTAGVMIMLELAGSIGFFLQNRGEVRTSQEAVWGVIRKFLERNIERSVLKKDRYTADTLLDELLGMGLLTETDGRIKFYHQLFQEFFAGYRLLGEDLEETVRRLDFPWWDEPLHFYAGLTDDVSPLIGEALSRNTVFSAANLLKASDNCNDKLRLTVYNNLLSMLTDKFELNREKSGNFLSTIRDDQIDNLLDQAISSDENEMLRKACEKIQKDRKESRPGDGLGIYEKSSKPETGNVADSRTLYSGSVSNFISKFERRINRDNISAIGAEIRKFAVTFGEELFTKELIKITKISFEVNRVLFLSWCVSIIKNLPAVEYLCESLPGDHLKKVFPDKLKRVQGIGTSMRISANIALDPNVAMVWRLEYSRFDPAGRGGVPAEEYAKQFSQAFLANVMWEKPSPAGKDEYKDEDIDFLLQVIWDLGPALAETFILETFKKIMHKTSGVLFIKFLKQYGLTEHCFKLGLQLFEIAPQESRIHFPELLAKTDYRNSLSFLMNLIKDEEQALELRSAALSAMNWHARKDEVPFLQELVNSDIPDLYDPA
ncbi:hypothetical protein IID62_03300, partial [candidate division KSB1 bacterium]|nr:hypothetical protein [candidate division KSB1 bacterium]